MTRAISIIGPGRVGKTLGKCLHRLGWRIDAVVARSNAHARSAVRWIGAGIPFGRLSGEALSGPVILISTPDTTLSSVAKELARSGGKHLKRKVVLHTSGALDSSVLEPLARCGAATGSLHPMQTFTGKEPPTLTNVIFAIEGAPAARRVARAIARELGGAPILIDPRGKAAYHAAGALAAGHALALIEAATQVLVRVGFTRRRALQALLPLMRQTLENFESAGPHAAWTGPIARKDYAIVAEHANALRRYPAEFNETYAALAVLSGRVLADEPAAAIANIRRALHKR